ncbi:hypothetical protein SDC9_205926 [bioreactor metagenome]|uniref:Uncharacterized protein n=1 Tax=bioreactor metagenome TaxID=1076179 RepID=A0A645JF36_9ZZZZ
MRLVNDNIDLFCIRTGIVFPHIIVMRKIDAVGVRAVPQNDRIEQHRERS